MPSEPILFTPTNFGHHFWLIIDTHSLVYPAINEAALFSFSHFYPNCSVFAQCG
jgi:hypothetical protein